MSSSSFVMTLVGAALAATPGPVVLGPSEGIDLHVSLLPHYDVCYDRQSSTWLVGKAIGEYGWIPAVSDVSQVGAAVEYIYGSARGKLFLLRTMSERAEPGDLRWFSSRLEWEQALSEVGLQANAEGMASPDTLARSCTEVELRPWRYRYLQNLAGFSDEDWASVLLILALLLSAGLALAVKSMWQVLVLSFGLGGLSGIAGDLLVFEGAGLGVIGQPICTAMLGLAASLARRRMHFRERARCGAA